LIDLTRMLAMGFPAMQLGILTGPRALQLISTAECRLALLDTQFNQITIASPS